MTMKFLGDKTIVEHRKNEKNLNLILDLDQTLIHTEIEYVRDKQKELPLLLSPYDTNNKRKSNLKKLKNLHSSIICEYKEHAYNYRVHGRLGLIHSLKELKDHFNIYIYTNGTYSYASNICKYIEKMAKEYLFSGIIARSSSLSSERKYIYILPYFNLYNTIIIDDRYDVWDIDNHYNLIQIREYIYKSHLEHAKDNDLCVLKELLLENKNYVSENNLHHIIENIKYHYNNAKDC
jgi:RNA polymerase II subunit A-like phosphatase